MKKLLLISIITFAMCSWAFSQTSNTIAKETPKTVFSSGNAQVVPNPSVAGIFNLKIFDNQDEFINYTVSDLHGNIIVSSDLREKGRTECIIDLAVYPSGLYVLTLHGRHTREVFKLMKIDSY